ncbi:Tubulin polymerization promoting protein family [Paragonimus heterotremus]|uniref:Tubulin polymerization promoting protein family n=1 Tax=Paragonimus heterotremus TaxID=100268 RepID=A0A8J4TBL7_9TREM|nr:Tubulin polymerization promoting protein family [Paragonimus heterotremus]
MKNMTTDLQTSFNAFCNFVKKGSNTATDKTLKKICTDCHIYGKGLDANRVDIEFRAHIGNTKRYVDFQEFVAFVEGRLAKAYAAANGMEQSEAAVELKSKIAQNAPAAHGATKVAADPITSRLTDVKGYTGSHKERFDAETGKGRGKEGRADKPPAFTTSGLSTPRK